MSYNSRNKKQMENKMKVKLILHEWKCIEKVVEGEVDLDDYNLDEDGYYVDENGDLWNAYGVGYLDDMDLGRDAMGYNVKSINSRIINSEYDYKIEVDKVEELK